MFWDYIEVVVAQLCEDTVFFCEKPPNRMLLSIQFYAMSEFYVMSKFYLTRYKITKTTSWRVELDVPSILNAPRSLALEEEAMLWPPEAPGDLSPPRGGPAPCVLVGEFPSLLMPLGTVLGHQAGVTCGLNV